MVVILHLNSSQVELDPLAIAIETVSSKTSEVRVLTALHSENKNLNINPLSMLLSGLIDAAVGGGIKNYRMVFFQPEYLASHPGDENRVKELKRLIEEQVRTGRRRMTVWEYGNVSAAGSAEERSGCAWPEDSSLSERDAGES